MSKSSNHMVKPCLQVAKDLSAGEQMHLLISPILCACFWSCVCPIITLEQHPNETAARKRKKSHYCMPLSSLSRMCHCSSLDALFTKQAARSMLTKRRVGSNLKGSLNWQVTETELLYPPPFPHNYFLNFFPLPQTHCAIFPKTAF